MSFQSFSKIPQPPRHRPKNLPSLQFISLINLLCQDTINQYDPRNHVLTIFSMETFEKALRQKVNRSLGSFEKQLKMIGFKKQRELTQQVHIYDTQGQDERVGIKYHWRGRKEEYLTKELGYTQKHLAEMFRKVTHFRDLLVDQKEKLDNSFEKTLFLGLLKQAKEFGFQNKLTNTLQMATETINWSHKTSGEIVRDIQINLDDEISLLRLLSFRHSQLSDE